MIAGDLIAATFIVGSLSLLAFLSGRQVKSNRKGLFVSTIFVAFIFSVFFQGKLGWAKLIPHSGALLLANFTPVLVAFIAGFACNGLDLRPKSRPFAVAALALVAAVCLFSPLVRPTIAPPQVCSIGKTKGDVVLQSHDSTCAPASAATLLKLHGIESNEQDMIGPCLTSQFGTEALGIYRGLKLGVGGKSMSVKVATNDPLAWASTGQLPAIALVRFPEDEFETDVSSKDQFEFPNPVLFTGQQTDEDGHAIVIMGRENGKWIIADPAIGMVRWSDEEFKTRFTGDALYIQRDGDSKLR